MRTPRAAMPLAAALFLFFLILLLIPASAFALLPSHPPPGLEKLIREALANNPRLKAAREKFDALSQRPSQARSWANPKVGFGIMSLPVNTFSFGQEPMTEKQFTVEQTIPFPGKLPLKGEIAAREADIADEAVKEEKVDLIRQVKTAYWDLLLIDKTIDVTRGNRDLLRDFVKTAENRYAVGKGIQQDVLQAQVELSKMIDALIYQRQEKETLTARMNALLYRSLDTEVMETRGEDLGKLKPAPFAVSAGQLEGMAAADSPVLAGARRKIKKDLLAVRLAKKDYYPDFDTEISYGQRDSMPDLVSGSVFVSIPLWHRTKEDKKVDEERAGVLAARQQYDSLRDDLFFRLKDAVLELQRYDNQIDLFRTGLIPQAQAALQSAIAAYSVNKVDFETLIDNQITLYNYEIKYYSLLADYENTIAGIEAAVGRQL